MFSLFEFTLILITKTNSKIILIDVKRKNMSPLCHSELKLDVNSIQLPNITCECFDNRGFDIS